MKILRLFNKLHSALMIPFLVSSGLIVAAEIINLIYEKIPDNFSFVFESLSELFYKAVPFIFCFFITQVLSKGKRGFKAFWSVLCLAVSLTCESSFGTTSLSLLLSFAISFIGVYFFKQFDFRSAMILEIFVSLLLGIISGYAGDYFDNFIMWISELISNKKAVSAILFSAADSIFSIFNIDEFRNAFFHKSFGGALFINGELVTGAKDLFISGYSGKIISTYLSGHYFVLFSVAGITAALANELKSVQRVVLIITAACSILSGNFVFFYIFVFLESPFLFISAILINMLSFVSAYVLNIDMGYIHNGSVIEMLINLNNGVYLFAGGIVFVCIGYFVTSFVIEKHSISDCFNIYFPTRLNRLVANLGGITNIIRFKNEELEVRNPELVNTLELDCEIEENIVRSDNELFNELKDYL